MQKSEEKKEDAAEEKKSEEKPAEEKKEEPVEIVSIVLTSFRLSNTMLEENVHCNLHFAILLSADSLNFCFENYKILSHLPMKAYITKLQI